ncbi:MAG: hypothetical protein M3R47_10380 [Chloroflexota bacterium]|nr:hypothetical protein [Chloroflexota bacterium]
MALLPIHIIAGLIGLVSGGVALSVRKGARLHRQGGMIFVYAMMVVALTGTVMGSLISEMAAVIPGALTFYLVLTSWLTVWRPVVLKFSLIDLGAMLLGLTISIVSFSYGFTSDGQPTVLYIIFGAVALLAILGDLQMMTQGIQGARRIARHLWRMCIALFLAAISLFIGQAQVFPEPLRNSGLLPIPVLLVLLIMFYWLVRVLFTQWYRRVQQQFPAHVSAPRSAAEPKH